MKRIGPGRIRDFRSATHAALDQVTAKCAILPKGDLVIFALNLAIDRHVARFGFLRCARRQHLRSDCFQCFSLLRASLLVDIIVGKIPVSKRFHHRLTLGALPHSRDGKSVEFHFSVIAFLNEEHLTAATGHLGRFGTEPTGTCGVARTGFFELAGNFPWSLIFWFIDRARSRSETEKRYGEHAERREKERRGFHMQDSTTTRVLDNPILTFTCQPSL